MEQPRSFAYILEVFFMQRKTKMTTKTLVYCALLAALSVVLARLFGMMPSESARFSIEAVPIFIAGMLFGPVAGGLVGFTADFVGCMFSQFGYNPIFCIPPMLYGIFAGLLRYFICGRREANKLRGYVFFGLRLGISLLLPVVLGSLLYQSATLSFMYFKGGFFEGFLYYLTTRSIQFAIVYVLELAVIYLLFTSGLFNRMGLWPLPRKGMTAKQAIAFIESVSWKGSVPGLERTQALLAKMGNPEKALKYVHIGGTNGKGSTCAMVVSILQKAGYKVGFYSSPHLYCFNERIQVNGQNISDRDLAAVTEYVKPLAKSMGKDIPTEFELVFCIAAEYFKRQGCDLVVLEVGMGGEMDATNVIPAPEVAAITNIGLDHTAFLGNTVEAIATTKAGIIKEGCTAVIYPSCPSVVEVLEGICKEKNVPARVADFDTITPISHDLEGQVFHCGSRENIQLPLLGQHQQFNCCMALQVVDALTEKGWVITEEHVYAGLRDVRWPGRFDIVSRDPLFIIDGGHNPQCLDALVGNIRDYLPGRKIIGLTGVLADKDYADMYKPVLPYIDSFVCITPPSDRKLEAKALAQHLEAVGAKATACDTIAEGVSTAKALAGQDGVVLCFGSLYSIGDIHKAL